MFLHNKRKITPIRDAAPSSLFFDRLELRALVKAWPYLTNESTLWYYEEVSRSVLFLVRALNRLGRRLEVKKIPYYFHDVRDEDGRCPFRSVLGDALKVTRNFMENEIKVDPLLIALSDRWPNKKLELHFSNRFREEIKFECLRIVMTHWLAGKEPTDGRAVLFIQKTQVFKYLEEYARERGVRLLNYKGIVPKNLTALFKAYPPSRFLKKTITRILPRTRSIEPLSRKRAMTTPAPEAIPRSGNGNNVAIQYGFRKLSFDIRERSEFFWLNGAGPPLEETVLYHYVSSTEPDLGLAETLKRGIRVFGRGNGARQLRPGRRFWALANANIRRVLTSWLKALLNGGWVHFGVLTSMLLLAVQVAWWRYFFETLGVRIKVSPNSIGSVAQVLALDEIGGVSAAYQYSIAVMNSPYSVFSCGETIQFVFSGMFEELWRRIEAPVDAFFHTGFIDDYAQQKLLENSELRAVRRELQDAGAEFIICFFDENTKSVWYQHAPDESACEHYRFLLHWLIEDKRIGMIFKPKNSITLFERLADIGGLIEQALGTGRCRFLTADTIVGSIFPAEVSLISDICIGILLGATSSLEAALTGVRAVLFDPEKNEGHPFYKWGKDRVVFQDWTALRRAIESFRTNPASFPDLGLWSTILNTLDPYRDGKANSRIGTTIQGIHSAFKAGLAKEDALEKALVEFASEFGRTHCSTAYGPGHTPFTIEKLVA